jgi:hypothetical protein
MSERTLLSAALVVGLLLTRSVGVHAQSDNQPGLIQKPDGKWGPAPGYTWVAPDDPNNLAVRIRPGLRVHHVEADGRPAFVPAPGHTWDGDPNDLRVTIRSDLRAAGYDADGIATSFSPAAGYEWVGNPDELITQLKPHLVVNSGRQTVIDG